MAKRRGSLIAADAPPEERLAQAYRNAFTSESGAIVMEDLRKRFGRRKSFVPDSDATAFHEGQRDVWLMILSFIEREHHEEEYD